MVIKASCPNTSLVHIGFFSTLKRSIASFYTWEDYTYIHCVFLYLGRLYIYPLRLFIPGKIIHIHCVFLYLGRLYIYPLRLFIPEKIIHMYIHCVFLYLRRLYIYPLRLFIPGKIIHISIASFYT